MIKEVNTKIKCKLDKKKKERKFIMLCLFNDISHIYLEIYKRGNKIR